jgi:hypothetical protein
LCTEDQAPLRATLNAGDRAILDLARAVDAGVLPDLTRMDESVMLAVGTGLLTCRGYVPIIQDAAPGMAGFTLCGSDALAVIGACWVVEQGVEGHVSRVAPLEYEESSAVELFRSLDAISRCLELLARQGLSEWVRSSLDRIVAVSDRSPFSGRYSVCGPEFPSTVFLDSRTDELNLVESVVHEASHQQLFILEQVSPLLAVHVLAPSPFRSGLRSLRRVLAGAHAFANSIYAIEACFGPGDRRVNMRLNDLRTKLQASLLILRNHEALSPAASQIVHSIAETHGIGTGPVPVAQGKRTRGPARSPWDWQVSKGPWYERFRSSASTWDPALLRQEEASEIKDSIETAAGRQDDWLFHPCMSSVLGAGGGTDGELNALGWIARHIPAVGAIQVDLPGPTIVWTPGGGRKVPSGRYRIGDLHQQPDDLLCLCFELDTTGAFFQDRGLSGEPDDYFRDDLRGLLRSMGLMGFACPQALEWASHVTKVLSIPLNSRRATLRSRSSPKVPGAVFLEIFGDMASTIELVVHESAHQMLFLAEAEGPLVHPEHRQLYWSPLRSDPRPLRGILLAFHALCYIAAVYGDLRRAGALERAQQAEASSMIDKALLAERVLQGAEGALTDAGIAFLLRTREVLDHAC